MFSLGGMIIGLAALDALNPATIAAQAYLLGTMKPLPRSLVFLASTFASYLASAVMLLVAGSEIALLFSSWPVWGWTAVQLTLGSLATLAGAWFWRSPKMMSAFKPPRSLGIAAAAVFAIASTAADIPTAIPLFAAIAGLTALNSLAVQIGLLTLYCLVYVTPLVALVTIHAVMTPANRCAWFGRITDVVDWIIRVILPPVLLISGIGAIVHAALSGSVF